LRKLLLAPDADGYGSTDGTEVIATSLAGGPSRFRRDFIGAPKVVNVQWTMNPSQYAYWRAFYATATMNGSLPFICDLVGNDGAGPAEHVCSFVPGSIGLPSQRGLTYVQQAQIEAKPLATDAVADTERMDIYEESQGQPDQWLAELSRLATVTIPSLPGFGA